MQPQELNNEQIKGGRGAKSTIFYQHHTIVIVTVTIVTIELIVAYLAKKIPKSNVTIVTIELIVAYLEKKYQNLMSPLSLSPSSPSPLSPSNL